MNPGRGRHNPIPLKIQDDAEILAASVLSLYAPRCRTADQHLVVVMDRNRLIQVIDFAAFKPGGAGAAQTAAARKGRAQPFGRGQLQERAFLGSPFGLDPRFGEADRDRSCGRAP